MLTNLCQKVRQFATYLFNNDQGSNIVFGAKQLNLFQQLGVRKVYVYYFFCFLFSCFLSLTHFSLLSERH